MKLRNKKKLWFAIIESHDSQINFSNKVGMDEAIISKVLHGHKKLRPEQAAVWRKALKCSPELLAEVTK